MIIANHNDEIGKVRVDWIKVEVLGGGSTEINGGVITTGKVESSDGNTFFDLDNDRMIVNDGDDDRVMIGDISTANDGSL